MDSCSALSNYKDSYNSSPMSPGSDANPSQQPHPPPASDVAPSSPIHPSTPHAHHPAAAPGAHPGAGGFTESSIRTTTFRDLGLKITGTRLEPIIAEFERELDRAGLTKVKPRFYLSTEWGVPFQTIALAIPFYLATPELEDIQAEQVGHIEGVSKADILRYLRHEMGHVVNYAYKLYERQDWVKLFGSITQPYVEEYRPQPFSRRFVRHLPGWYAQKHPDEDWAETFAVWLTAASSGAANDWRKDYSDWPTALQKLEYCDRVLAELRDAEPLVKAIELDEDVGELTYSVQEFFDRTKVGEDPLPPGLAGALTAIFEDLGTPEKAASDGDPKDTPRKPASALIRKMERELLANVFRWTGHFPEKTRPLVRHLAHLADELKQVYPANQEAAASMAITTLVTALAMNHVHRGTYLP
jgi:hypothetical protein